MYVLWGGRTLYSNYIILQTLVADSCSRLCCDIFHVITYMFKCMFISQCHVFTTRIKYLSILLIYLSILLIYIYIDLINIYISILLIPAVAWRYAQYVLLDLSKWVMLVSDLFQQANILALLLRLSMGNYKKYGNCHISFNHAIFYYYSSKGYPMFCLDAVYHVFCYIIENVLGSDWSKLYHVVM